MSETTKEPPHVIGRPWNGSHPPPADQEFIERPGHRELTNASLAAMLARAATANGANFKAHIPGYALVAVLEELVSWRDGTHPRIVALLAQVGELESFTQTTLDDQRGDR